jgi:L-arabinonolactonase
MKYQPELIVDGGHELGEGVLWCEVSQSVFWTDIHAATLWNHHPASGVIRSWNMPERLATFAFTVDADRLLLGLASRLAFFNLKDGGLEAIADVEEHLPTTRLNDGKCDRQGRFVFGTLNEAADRAPIAGFYRLNHDLSVQRLNLPGIAISNSICFSPDGGTLYFCDTLVNRIMCVAYDSASGDVGEPRLFADLATQPGSPDGSCVDADGFVWNAQWGGARVVRFAPDGSIDHIIELPVGQPSCVAFGGTQLDTLYITSAHEGMNPAQREIDPQAGGLFAVRLEETRTRGLAANRFGA